MVRNNFKGIEDRVDASKEEFFEHFAHDWEEAYGTIRGGKVGWFFFGLWIILTIENLHESGK